MQIRIRMHLNQASSSKTCLSFRNPMQTGKISKEKPRLRVLQWRASIIM